MRGMTDGMADGRCEAIFEQRAGLAGSLCQHDNLPTPA
jgi:hypothetical protein